MVFLRSSVPVIPFFLCGVRLVTKLSYCFQITTKFAVELNDNEEKLPTLHWLP